MSNIASAPCSITFTYPQAKQPRYRRVQLRAVENERAKVIHRQRKARAKAKKREVR